MRLGVGLLIASRPCRLFRSFLELLATWRQGDLAQAQPYAGFVAVSLLSPIWRLATRRLSESFAEDGPFGAVRFAMKNARRAQLALAGRVSLAIRAATLRGDDFSAGIA